MPGPVGQVGLAVDGVGAKSGLFGRQFRRPGDDRRAIYHRDRRGEHRVRVGRIGAGNIVLPYVHVVALCILLVRRHRHRRDRV